MTIFTEEFLISKNPFHFTLFHLSLYLRQSVKMLAFRVLQKSLPILANRSLLPLQLTMAMSCGCGHHSNPNGM